MTPGQLHTPPDGGYGWVIVFSSFFLHFMNNGLVLAMGVLCVYWYQEFNSSKTETSWIVSCNIAVMLVFGPFASSLAAKIGYRAMTILGSCFITVAMVLSTRVASIIGLLLTISIIGGIGAGMVYLPAVAVPALYFEKRRSLAVGLGTAGIGGGMFMMGPIINFLVEYYGWRGAMYVLAGFSFNLCVAGALLRPIEDTRPPPEDMTITVRYSASEAASDTDSLMASLHPDDPMLELKLKLGRIKLDNSDSDSASRSASQGLQNDNTDILNQTKADRVDQIHKSDSGGDAHATSFAEKPNGLEEPAGNQMKAENGSPKSGLVGLKTFPAIDKPVFNADKTAADAYHVTSDTPKIRVESSSPINSQNMVSAEKRHSEDTGKEICLDMESLATTKGVEISETSIGGGDQSNSTNHNGSEQTVYDDVRAFESGTAEHNCSDRSNGPVKISTNESLKDTNLATHTQEGSGCALPTSQTEVYSVDDSNNNNNNIHNSKENIHLAIKDNMKNNSIEHTSFLTYGSKRSIDIGTTSKNAVHNLSINNDVNSENTINTHQPGEKQNSKVISAIPSKIRHLTVSGGTPPKPSSRPAYSEQMGGSLQSMASSVGIPKPLLGPNSLNDAPMGGSCMTMLGAPASQYLTTHIDVTACKQFRSLLGLDWDEAIYQGRRVGSGSSFLSKRDVRGTGSMFTLMTLDRSLSQSRRGLSRGHDYSRHNIYGSKRDSFRSRNSSFRRSRERPEKRSIGLNIKRAVVEQISLLRDTRFFLFAISNFLTNLSIVMPAVFMVDRAISSGMDSNFAALLVSLNGIGTIGGRVLIAAVADHPLMNRLAAYVFVLVMAGVFTSLSPFCGTSMLLHGCYAIIFGILIGNYGALCPCVFVDLKGLEGVGESYGLLLMFMGASNLMGAPIGGVLYDLYGNFSVPFILHGLFLVSSGLVVLPLLLQKKKGKEKQRNRISS